MVEKVQLSNVVTKKDLERASHVSRSPLTAHAHLSLKCEKRRMDQKRRRGSDLFSCTSTCILAYHLLFKDEDRVEIRPTLSGRALVADNRHNLPTRHNSLFDCSIYDDD